MALVSIGDLRRMFGGVGAARADQLTRRPGFPEPVATLPSGRIWDEDQVAEWIKKNRPTQRDADES